MDYLEKLRNHPKLTTWTEEEYQERLKHSITDTAQKDIVWFLKHFFPKHFHKSFASFHKEIFDTLFKYPRVVIGAPRGHGKSEIISFGFVMWNLLLNPDCHFIIIISNNYANSVKYLNPIKEEIEFNDELKNIFGDLKSDKWSENEIELKNEKKVIVGGNEFKIRGQKYLQHRPDLIIIDDAEDDELVRSEARRDNFEKWMLYSLEPAMTHTEKDKIIMVGTIIHRASQLSKMMGKEGKYRNWHSDKYEAMNRDGTEALWGKHITLDWLKAEKEKDPYKFAQEYMNNPVPYEHAMFKEEYFDNYTDDQLPEELVINITCDLACSDREYSDYTVILPCGIDKNGDLWVLPYKRGKYVDPDKIIEDIFNVYKTYSSKWAFGKFGIEKNNFQRFLARNFDRERKKRGIRIPVYEVLAKGDKTQRISQLQPLFAAGDIHVRADMLDLKQELLDFPRALHDDISDALAQQLEFLKRRPVAKEHVGTHWKVTPEMQRQKYLDKELRKPKVLNVCV